MVSEESDRTQGGRARGQKARTGPNSREALFDLVHLFGLGSFAVAQPLFEVLEPDATFFVARRSAPVDIVLLALILIGIAPLVLGTLEFLAGLVSLALRRVVHRVAVGLLVTLIALPPLVRTMEVGSVWTLVLAASFGILAALGAGWSPLRSFLTLLGLAPPVFAGLFLASPSIAKLLFPPTIELGPDPTGDSDSPSVVMLVLDELPMSSLLDADRSIDAVRFPNFARLAREGTWFRNASTSHTHTIHAIPCMLTGREPSDPELLPIVADHPGNLFTLLARSHRMNVYERITLLLPPELDGLDSQRPSLSGRMSSLLTDCSLIFAHVALPPDLVRGLPTVTGRWDGFLGTIDSGPDESQGLGGRESPGQVPPGVFRPRSDPPGAFHTFLEGFEEGSPPTLHFMHLLLPHFPWIYLPSGKLTTVEGQLPEIMIKLDPRGEAETVLAWQRHFLQLGFADRLLGELLERMESTGILDSALLVVVADHGVCFKQGVHRRKLGARNLDDLLRVPLLVKFPGQRTGRTSDESVEGIDILPTITDALGVDPTWPVDGRSLLDLSSKPRAMKLLHSIDGTTWEVDAAPPTSWPTLERRLELFGASSPWERIFGIGPRHVLLGTDTSGMSGAPSSGTSLRTDRGWRHEAFDPDAAEVPSLVLGQLRNANPEKLPSEIAVSVDGKVRAVAPLLDRDAEGAPLAVMLPESAFRPGRNRVEVFAVLEDGRLELVRERSWTLVTTPEGKSLSASDGSSIVIDDDSLRGGVTQSRETANVLELSGWAADQDPGIVDILVFVEGLAQPFSAGTGSRRPSLVKRTGDEELAQSGFKFELPLELFGGSPVGRVRVIALSGTRAAELPLRRAASWLRAP